MPATLPYVAGICPTCRLAPETPRGAAAPPPVAGPIGVPGAPIVRRDGTVRGLVDLSSLDGLPEDKAIPASVIVREPILASDDGLDDALGDLSDHGRTWAPVVASGRLAGVLSIRDAMTAYRTALNGNIRQVRGLRTGGVIIETQIVPGSALAGRLVSEVEWPREAVLVAIERDNALLVPRGDLEIHAGDHVSIFATPAAQPRVEALLEAPSVESKAPPVESEPGGA